MVIIVNSHMADAIRILIMRVGLAPEEFVLYSFGGTGSMHSPYYAAELGIKKIYCFPTSSVFLAFGIAGADMIRTMSLSLGARMPVEPGLLNTRIQQIEASLADDLAAEGFDRNDLAFRHTFNMRWARQVLYHSVSVPAKEYRTEADVSGLVEEWVRDFERVYGKGVAYQRTGMELVSMDVDAVGKVVKPALRTHAGAGTDSSAALKGRRPVFFPEGTDDFTNTPIFQYEALHPKNVIDGPAIIESTTTTIVVPPGKLATVDAYRNVVLTL